jgi:hypothetical protein
MRCTCVRFDLSPCDAAPEPNSAIPRTVDPALPFDTPDIGYARRSLTGDLAAPIFPAFSGDHPVVSGRITPSEPSCALPAHPPVEHNGGRRSLGLRMPGPARDARRRRDPARGPEHVQGLEIERQKGSVTSSLCSRTRIARISGASLHWPFRRQRPACRCWLDENASTYPTEPSQSSSRSLPYIQ